MTNAARRKPRPIRLPIPTRSPLNAFGIYWSSIIGYWQFAKRRKLDRRHRCSDAGLVSPGQGIITTDFALRAKSKLIYFLGVAVDVGLTDAAGVALEFGLGAVLKIGRMPVMFGFLISPSVFLTGRVLRFLMAVQRSDATPPMRILERPAATISRFLPGGSFGNRALVCQARLSLALTLYHPSKSQLF
jgi:hypothetical protein